MSYAVVAIAEFSRNHADDMKNVLLEGLMIMARVYDIGMTPAGLPCGLNLSVLCWKITCAFAESSSACTTITIIAAAVVVGKVTLATPL